MPDKNPEILKIYRLLTPKHRAELHAWIHLAYAAENSVRKSLGFEALADGVSSFNSRDCSCEKFVQRSEK